MNIEDFVQNYAGDDLLKVIFNWNGKHADKLEDYNIEFRKRILDYFKKNQSSCSIQLVADLYEAETQLAKEAWEVNPIVSDLAQELLERGREKYVLDFLEGLGRGMDAFIQSRQIELSTECLVTLLKYCQSNREIGVFENKKQADMLVELFQWKLENKR